jgi:hypothetical protein
MNWISGDFKFIGTLTYGSARKGATIAFLKKIKKIDAVLGGNFSSVVSFYRK